MNERVFALVGLGALAGVPAVLVQSRAPAWMRVRAIGVALAAALVVLTFHSPLATGVAVALAVVVLAVPDGQEREHPLGALALPLVLTSLAGVWVAVPDVEPALVVAGSLMPLAVLHLQRRRGPGVAGTWLLVASVVWTVVIGAAGRTPPLAAVACLGMVAVAPMVFGWDPRRVTATATVVLVVAHLTAAVPVGRLAMRQDVPVAFALAVCSVALQVLVALAVRVTLRSRRPVR